MRPPTILCLRPPIREEDQRLPRDIPPSERRFKLISTWLSSMEMLGGVSVVDFVPESSAQRACTFSLQYAHALPVGEAVARRCAAK
jgi:hypothetical protein